MEQTALLGVRTGEDMLNKLKDNLTSYASSAVTNTVYNTGNIISGVLPGNPVTR